MGTNTLRIAALLAVIAGGLPPSISRAFAMRQAQAAPAKLVGTIKAITGNTISLLSDDGKVASVQVDSSTRIFRVELGQKDLKSATRLDLTALTAGDRIVVRGQPTNEGAPMQASLIMAMTRADLTARQEQEKQQWQHGTGGLVTSIEPAAATIHIVTTGLAGKKTTVVHVSNNTVIRRYAPDSVKFQDAKIASFSQIKVGDQLRARGSRIAEGDDFNADEIVAGTFRNIAGTVVSTDPSANSLSVLDAATKKPVTVKLSSDTQLRKLPPQMAQHIAMRLKGEVPSGPTSNGAGTVANPAAGAPSGQAAGSPRRNGGADFQQMLSRVPPVTIAELQKGDAVMIVSTEGSDSGAVTAITLLAGVEPILAASPKGGGEMVLSPWTLGGGGGEDSNP